MAIRVSKAAGLSLAVVLGILVAGPAPVEAGSFETERLRDCVGYTRSDLTHAPEGTQLPYGGIRVFAKDHQRGRSRAYCLTMSYSPGRFCCGQYAEIVMPRALRRNVESLRFVLAPQCFVGANLYTKDNERVFSASSQWSGPESKWRDIGIPERADDRMYRILGLISCWDGDT